MVSISVRQNGITSILTQSRQPLLCRIITYFFFGRNLILFSSFFPLSEYKLNENSWSFKSIDAKTKILWYKKTIIVYFSHKKVQCCSHEKLNQFWLNYKLVKNDLLISQSVSRHYQYIINFKTESNKFKCRMWKFWNAEVSWINLIAKNVLTLTKNGQI